MSTWVKIVWLFAIIVNIVSLIWFLLGSTANFQRPLDLINTVTLITVWVPSLLLVVLSTILFIKGWVASNFKHIGVWLILLALLFFAVPLFKGVNTEGWLYDHITSDPIKITSDGEFEYRTELINLFQKNSRERLYLRNVSTGREMYIPIDINTTEIYGIWVREGDDWMWALLSPTDVPNQYELTTTEILRVPKNKFLIDIGTGTSQRLE